VAPSRRSSRQGVRPVEEDFVESFTDLQMEQVMGGPTGETGPEDPGAGKSGEKGREDRAAPEFPCPNRPALGPGGMLATARQGSPICSSRRRPGLSPEASARCSPMRKGFPDALERQRGRVVGRVQEFLREEDRPGARPKLHGNSKDEYLAGVRPRQRIVKRRGEGRP